MKTNLRRNVKAVEQIIRRFSPEILTALGIATGVAGTVIACKKSMTIKEKLEPVSDEIQELKNEAKENEQPVEKKELAKKYGKAAVVVAQEYAPVIILETVSITCILSAAGILKKRNASIAAGYAALDKLFKDYRSRVVEDYGEEKDNDYYYGLRNKKVKEVIEDPETGKKKTITHDEKVCTREEDGEFTFIFGAGNPNYKGDPFLDRSFLVGVEGWACDQVVGEHVVYNSDILEALGWDRKNIPASARTHGTLKKNHENDIHPVSLGIHKKENNAANCEADIDSHDNNTEWVITISNDGYILDSFI